MRARALLLLAAAQALHLSPPLASRALRPSPVSLLRVPQLPSMSQPPPPEKKLPFFLDIGTKGGIVFYSILGIALPFVAYSYMVDVLDLGVVVAGNVILVLYVGLGIVAWTGRNVPPYRSIPGSLRVPTFAFARSYVFRVANKDMTYAQQLKDYENAVIQKRFEELSTEEVRKTLLT